MGRVETELFVAGSVRCAELAPEAIPALQAFFEANPEYHIAVSGRPPGPDEAREEFESLPPPEWPFEKRWMLGFFGNEGAMIGMANVVSNLFAAGVWHLGLFVVASSLHGGGASHHLYDELESWMRVNGARWLRLGVVEGNRRAERFWEKHGYVDVRRRLGVQMGDRVNDLRVMVKPLGNGKLSEYFARVVRDCPDSP